MALLKPSVADTNSLLHTEVVCSTGYRCATRSDFGNSVWHSCYSSRRFSRELHSPMMEPWFRYGLLPPRII